MTYEQIQELIACGVSDDEIEAAVRAEEDEPDYDHDEIEYEDHRSTREMIECDRMDMGRNDAGEWLGYM